MDVDFVKKIEVLLDVPAKATIEDLDYRIGEIHKAFDSIKSTLMTATPYEKGTFLSLLSRTNELVRVAMEIKLKRMGMSFDKLHDFVEKARHSKNEKLKPFVAALEFVQAQSENLTNTLAKVDARLSKTQGSEPKKISQGKKLRRQRWTKS